MAEEGDVYGLSEPDLDATLRLIDERSKLSQPDIITGTTDLIIAYTSAGATARVGTTLGTGTAVKYFLATSGSNRILTAADDTASFTFYNMSTGAVAAGAYIMLLLHGADWVCNWEEC